MSAPLTAAEEAALASALAAIEAGQDADDPVQVLADDVDAVVALGVPRSLAEAALAAGFRFRLDEYSTARGARGWCAHVRLVRDGLAWSFARDCGVEPWRSHGWRPAEAAR